MLRVRKTRPEDIAQVARKIRKEDLREIISAHGVSALEALKQSAARSQYVFTAMRGNVPVCIFGLAPESFLGGRALLWLLGATDIATCKTAYYKTCKKWVALFLKKYPVLYNAVDYRYLAAIKWLRKLGAEFTGRRIKGVDGTDFLIFTIRRK